MYNYNITFIPPNIYFIYNVQKARNNNSQFSSVEIIVKIAI